MKIQPLFPSAPKLRPYEVRSEKPSASASPDQVELSSPNAHNSEPLLEKGISQSWWACLQTTLQQLSGPIAPLVKTVLEVWMGGKRESSFHHTRDFAEEGQARAQFEKAKTRLLNPNQWKKLGPGLLAADFKLYCDDRRKAKEGAPEVGDYLKIRLPDLGHPAIAHFFSEHTTNHFQMRREGTRLISRVVGRSEALNGNGDFGDRLLSLCA